MLQWRVWVNGARKPDIRAQTHSAAVKIAEEQYGSTADIVIYRTELG